MIPRSLPALLLLLLSLSPPPSLSEDSAAGKKKKMDALLQEQFCKNFTVGKPRESEFYSPGHPGDYPPDITCFRTLTADIGYFVRVDFRDLHQWNELDLKPGLVRTQVSLFFLLPGGPGKSAGDAHTHKPATYPCHVGFVYAKFLMTPRDSLGNFKSRAPRHHHGVHPHMAWRVQTLLHHASTDDAHALCASRHIAPNNPDGPGTERNADALKALHPTRPHKGKS